MTYAGNLANEYGSQVRFNLDGKKIEGLIKSGGKTYLVESAKNYSLNAAPDDVVIYNEADVMNAKAVSCGLETKISLGTRMIEQKIKEQQFTNARFEFGSVFTGFGGRKTNLAQTARYIEFITDADWQMIQRYQTDGSPTNSFNAAVAAINDIQALMNLVEPLFQNNFNISFTILSQFGWLDRDPYDEYGAGGRVPIPHTNKYSNWVWSNFLTYWSANRPQSAYRRDSVILFTSKGVNYSLSFPGSMCGGGYSGDYSFVMTLYYGNTETVLNRGTLGHELAHTIGGGHVEDDPQVLDANQNCYNSVLGPYAAERDYADDTYRLCPFSVNQINAYLSTNDSCLY